MRTLAAALVAVLALLLPGCGGGSSTSGVGSSAAVSARTLTVSAASSLTGTFDQLATQFMAAHAGVSVKVNYGGSSDLAQQIVAGAPVDVFAAASTATMDTVSKAGLTAGPPTVFATNQLEIAVAPGNPKGITSLADLARPGLTVVVCAPQVPCGAATQKVEQVSGVRLHPASEEPEVRSVLSKVVTGNADAGLVYVTDVRAANGKVAGVEFADAARAVNSYPIAVIKSSRPADLAAEFVALVSGPAGRAVFTQAGFGTL